MWHLTATSGPLSGRTWPVASAMVVGRSAGCAIALPDAAVSREHGRFVLDGPVLRYEDLGSSNLSLLNGQPIESCEIQPGDEVAIGATVFLASRLDAAPTTDSAFNTGATASIAIDDALLTADRPDAEGVQGRPRTVHDLALLYGLTQKLSVKSTVDELRMELIRAIQTEFAPLLIVTGVYDPAKGAFVFHSAPHLTPDKRTHNLLLQTVEQQRGFLASRRGRSLKDLCIQATAPLALGAGNMGVLLMETAVNHRVYDESDLQLLVSMVRMAAPYFLSVDRVARLQETVRSLEDAADRESRLVGESDAIMQVRHLARQMAAAPLPVLITGETGTGKELVAQMIHALSPRRDEPFIVVNCAAIPKELFESEMFGHEKGAFTGATTARKGRMVQAHGGTLFLDEIGDLSPENQARILRAIETGEFHPLGATDAVRVDVRILAATNAVLREAVSQGTFREDLYHRIAAVQLHLPPLRERVDDIPVLAQHFLNIFHDEAPQPLTGFSPAATEALTRHPWPGNVRELRNTIQRAVHLATGPTIDVDDLHLPVHAEPPNPAEDSTAPRSLAETERESIEAALRETGGNVSAAARLLGIHRNTLHRKLAEHGLGI